MNALTFATRPETCPACGAPITREWTSDSGSTPYVLYACSLLLANFATQPIGYQGEWPHECSNAFTAAIEARATLARLDALLAEPVYDHSATWFRERVRQALISPATSAEIDADKRLELREEVKAG